MKKQRGSLDAVFNPKSVAVTGASPGKQGQLFLDSFLASGYKGKVYAINSKGQEVSGMKAYTSVKELPEPVDYVVCCIPAPAVPQFIRDCGAKGVKAVSVFTAGFSEIGTDEGKRLEKEVVRAARETGVRIIGPNCLGVYAPKVGFSYTSDFPKQSGSVAYVCQSGGNSVYVTRAAGYRGVRFSKVISYGNACDINECELLEYLIQDDDTKIVAVYIEGVRNGPRFYRALTELTRTKPVVVLKGGYTKAGAKAAASHTGSLAGSDEVWDELLQQAGAIRVYSLEELVDVLVTVYLLPTPQGRRVGIFGGGGGATVLGADDWSKYGFVLPPLPKVIKEELRASVPTEAGLILQQSHRPLQLRLQRTLLRPHQEAADLQGLRRSLRHPYRLRTGRLVLHVRIRSRDRLLQGRRDQAEGRHQPAAGAGDAVSHHRLGLAERRGRSPAGLRRRRSSRSTTPWPVRPGPSTASCGTMRSARQRGSD